MDRLDILLVAAVAIAIGITLIFAAPFGDGQHCVAGHHQPDVSIMIIGDTLYPITTDRFVCDRWVPRN